MSESSAALMKKAWLIALFAGVCVIVVVILLVSRDAPPSPTDVVEDAAPATVEPGITLVNVDALPAVSDPFDAQWDGVPVHEAKLEPQMMAAPMLDEVTVERIEVQAMSDGRAIAWRLSWPVPEPARHVDTGQFPDAVALQFPLADGAPPIMGSEGRPVQILYWSALWQRDVDEGFVDLHDLYPNFWSDVYWFVGGGFPFPVSEAFNDERAREWLVAHAADNPMAQLDRAEPVQELFAEGFGTLTARDESHATARGAWRDGRWTVVIQRSLASDDALASRLASGEVDEVALAVWHGAAGNVGGRKHWTMWIPIDSP